jgi:hypothetical protein
MIIGRLRKGKTARTVKDKSYPSEPIELPSTNERIDETANDAVELMPITVLKTSGLETSDKKASVVARRP